MLPTAGNLREINRHLPYYCPDCLRLASQPADAPQPPEIPQAAEVGTTQVEADEYTPLIKIICAPIYKYKQEHVSVWMHPAALSTAKYFILTCTEC